MSHSTTAKWCEAVREYIAIPEHIQHCADACASDLLYGPKRAIIPAAGLEAWDGETYSWGDDPEEDVQEGDKIEEVYTGSIGTALREFIDSLPSDLYWDTESGEILTSEPDGEWLNADFEPCNESDDDAEWCDPTPYYELDSRDIVESLFGITIARKFR